MLSWVVMQCNLVDRNNSLKEPAVSILRAAKQQYVLNHLYRSTSYKYVRRLQSLM
jgi:hypothetical protein